MRKEKNILFIPAVQMKSEFVRILTNHDSPILRLTSVRVIYFKQPRWSVIRMEFTGFQGLLNI